MLLHRRLLQFFSLVAALSLLFSSISTSFVSIASAQGGDGLERQRNAQTGKINFIIPPEGRSIPASRLLGTGASILPQDAAWALAKRFATEFGEKDPENDLKEMKITSWPNGHVTSRFRQSYHGIPVMGGELIVNTDQKGNLYSLNGEVASNLSLSVQPAVDIDQAKQTAIKAMAKWYEKKPTDFLVSEPELWIYEEGLLQTSTQLAELVWRMEATPTDTSMPVRELVLVNAQRGGISLHFNQVDQTWRKQDYRLLGSSGALNHSEETHENSIAAALSPVVSTYTANNGSSLPGTFLCSQASPNCPAGDSHAKAAHTYAIGTYNLYATQFGRNSINNGGMKIISTVHYQNFYENAFWNGSQMVYGDGDGFPLADDVVGHELTHGVTEYESNLFYYYQSGAINESLSDVFGEYFDQTNGQGNDSAGVRWLLGEDISGLGAIRSMSNPTAYGNPDTMSSYYYYTGAADNGGVHANSGVNNKAAFLMVDGGWFNGQTITALGWTKTAAIYYEANTNLLTSAADYSDLYYALQQACWNLVGQKGINAGDCLEVRHALDAVEMNTQPTYNFNPDAPLCDSGSMPKMVFTDDLETGTGNWTFSNGSYRRWQWDSPYGKYAQSGLHSLYADDYPDQVTDAPAMLKPLYIPANAYLHFAQAYDFESGYSYYDGGVLEYSLNNGGSWIDAGPLMQDNGYRGSISTYFGNPLAGRSAFVGSSHGYISSRLNLAPLAGNTVSFRWRMGLDFVGYAAGWWVDNVKLYTCAPPPGPFGKTVPYNGAYTASVSPILSWQASTGATSYEFCYDTTNDGTCSNWVNNGASTSVALNGLAPNTTYYWQVRATNGEGITYSDGSPAAFWSFISLLPPGSFTKSSPPGGASGVSLNPTLSWGASVTASSYQYCYDTINDNQCNRTWGGTTNTSVAIANLGANTTYYWQVRAVNAAGTTYANNQVWSSFTTTSTLPAGTAGIDAVVGMNSQGKYSLGSGQSLRESYAGVNNGSVEIVSNNSIPLIGAERVVYKVNGVNTSFTEMMALPSNQVGNVYWLPWYNNVDLDTQLRFGNVSGNTATIHVYIGGDEMQGSPLTLPTGQSTRISFAGVNNGPVKVESDQDIVAAERVIYKVSGINTSFSEMMALPDSQLNTTYWLPWYNNVDLDTQLRFGNVSDDTATVHIYIGTDEMPGSPFTLQPGDSTRQSFAGINNGPVRIASDQEIVASERLIYKVNGVNASFTEMMALPDSQLNATYWLPWYNNVDLDTQLRFGNVANDPATVHVYIGGVEMPGSPFVLQPGGSLRKSFTGVNNGPVKIEGDQDIVTAERVVYKVNNLNTSFSEMMGLPDSQLDSVYWLPWYNNVDLDTQLRFGVP